MNHDNDSEAHIRQLLDQIDNLDYTINGQKQAGTLRAATKLRMYLNRRAQFTDELCRRLCLQQRARQRSG
jgi:hypothetical protein